MTSIQTTPLPWKRFPAGESGFFRAPVLNTGASETLLIDGGFTLAEPVMNQFSCRQPMTGLNTRQSYPNIRQRKT
jgi:hypothetical protein